MKARKVGEYTRRIIVKEAKEMKPRRAYTFSMNLVKDNCIINLLTRWYKCQSIASLPSPFLPLYLIGFRFTKVTN